MPFPACPFFKCWSLRATSNFVAAKQVNRLRPFIEQSVEEIHGPTFRCGCCVALAISALVLLGARAQSKGSSVVLRVVPQSNLAILDPVST